ncbi:MAG: cobalt ABC transporter ATP-binding protein, partial [Anaerolineaceae bacterium]|nr:cobalt ABC transporter ATP-binding protein [Anaerolineaceae bacterium]
RREFIDLLSLLKQTLFIATHDLELARHVTSRLIILDQGRVVADGETEALLADRDLLLAYGLA